MSSLLDQLPSLAPKLEREESKSNHKRFIIALSREMSLEDQAIFAQHGKVLMWSNRLVNIPFESLEFDYLLLDVRCKEARLTLQRQDLGKYHKIAYVWWIQKHVDDFLLQLETVDISSVPQHAVNRADFEHMLLSQKLSSPSLVKSFLRLLKSCISGA
jgi:hypothetical protein